MLTISTKTFKELTIDELYAILQLRSEIFVVEQNCVYQDLDYKDQNGLHVLGYKDHKIVAYTRIFKPDDYFEHASIGRVLVKAEERHLKYGYTIMEASINEIEKRYNETKIKISAQAHLKNFYNTLGFKEIGDVYFEDGIPHIGMIKD
ncbi:GNAT family N-acetyltransferase [Gelidibacter salicanalis]|uniref:GNAT family N-acetyltransferase n=1 Tax=Gelidibacter salicanalis TaxID=291193 RepID=A0A934NI41_9FLAO|nr:GNAT family N-acetyltransferase [Gelidibacter salicanalis]MBJ7879644.1 GNAT family N-acetyltransferase [Gelidibacter salicanalis]